MIFRLTAMFNLKFSTSRSLRSCQAPPTCPYGFSPILKPYIASSNESDMTTPQKLTKNPGTNGNFTFPSYLTRDHFSVRTFPLSGRSHLMVWRCQLLGFPDYAEALVLGQGRSWPWTRTADQFYRGNWRCPITGVAE